MLLGLPERVMTGTITQTNVTWIVMNGAAKNITAVQVEDNKEGSIVHNAVDGQCT